jgi:hypothetical protein
MMDELAGLREALTELQRDRLMHPQTGTCPHCGTRGEYIGDLDDVPGNDPTEGIVPIWQCKNPMCRVRGSFV